jgi:catechol 2,3-dioxygenase-like lactoylglutathione lyase family enzyme
VADADRSRAFYRDVLGFEVRPGTGDDDIESLAEVLWGPARIRLVAPGGQEGGGRRIVFLETDDVDALRASFLERGAEASETADANWIKMRMFEVRDPDGHVLWFGRSFAEPVPPPPPPMVCEALPELPVDDVAAAVDHYRDVLGFSVTWQGDDLGYMKRDRVTVVLLARTARHTGIGSTEFYVADADALHGELVAKGGDVRGEPVSHPWGMRAFVVEDPWGNRLTFIQTFE